MSRIRIKNFGPIKEGFTENDGWIEVDKVTVFIGNQGAGKSTVAKLISVFTWIEKEVFRRHAVDNTLGNNNSESPLISNGYFKQLLAYQNIEEYLTDDSSIHYSGKAYSITCINGKLDITPAQLNSYQFPKIMYVPAERNFISAVNNINTLKGLPGTLYTFADEFLNALEKLNGRISLPINLTQLEYNADLKTSFVVGKDYKLRLSQSSSGFQSLVPLFLVSQYLSDPSNQNQNTGRKHLSIEDDKYYAKLIQEILANRNLTEEVRQASLNFISQAMGYSAFINIVEEPEQNLFPGSQKHILYSLLGFNNFQPHSKLILTTHSPYIINYLSLVIQGAALRKKIAANGENNTLVDRMANITPLNALVEAEEVKIYELSETSGTIKALKSSYGIPSDNNYLNNQLKEGNTLFDQLLEIEEEL